MASSLPTQQELRLLKDKLNLFYDQRVIIPRDEMKRNKEIVENVKKNIKEYLSKKKNVEILQLENIGSVYEGLKVGSADEFDLLMLLKGHVDWEVIDKDDRGFCTIRTCRPLDNAIVLPRPQAPRQIQQPPQFGPVFVHTEYVVSTRPMGAPPPQWNLSKPEPATVNEAQAGMRALEQPKPYQKCMVSDARGNEDLSPQKVRSVFQSYFQQWIDSLPGGGSLRYQMETGGPATTVNVFEGNKKLMGIDFTPAYDIGEDLVIAKPHPDLKNQGELGTAAALQREKFWMQSNCREEREIMRQIDDDDNGCRKKVVKILKVIKLNNTQLRCLSSYFFKAILLHMPTRGARWGHDAIAERFIEMIQLLERSLREKKLLNYFNPNINHFAEKDPATLENLQGYLHRIIQKKAYIDLLK
ncbi:unnamed protein product [Owenia fusiformis]|uniref:Uncharacterized protein n=1 Tax=Owenia fusiformis TaxID=6347 RepID=A0A8J1UPD6_OWEFU|nr:unnamed protein product [Owenia fusiformis]